MELKNVYSINIEKGVTVITKHDDNYIGRKNEYSYTPDLFIDPVITIDSGLLTITGNRYHFDKVRNLVGYHWVDIPTSELVQNFREIAYFTDGDIYKKDVTKWKGWFIFKLPTTVKDVEFIKCGWYLSLEPVHETITTSNFRLVNHDKTIIKGQINE
jgi:hypothetical protein